MSRPADYPDRDAALLFELARDRLNTQLSTIDALDSKISLLFSIASALLGLVAAVVALWSAVTDDSLSTPALVVLAAAGVAYGFVVVGGLKAYYGQTWAIGPDLGQIWTDQWGADTDEVLRWKAANAIWADYESNRAAVQAKTAALPLLFAGVIVLNLLLVVALVLVAAGV